MAITKAQARATAKYKAKHPTKTKAYQAKSYAKRFIREYATSKDLDELDKLIRDRRRAMAQAHVQE